MIDLILIILLLAITAAIVFYLVREKRRGVKCIGCPHAKQCAKKSCTHTCSTKGRHSGTTNKQ